MHATEEMYALEVDTMSSTANVAVSSGATVNSETTDPSPLKYPPSIRGGVVLYLGYLAIFFATWAMNGVDYNRIGENARTLKLWYACPTLFGCAFLVVGLHVLGWWRVALFDKTRSGPAWIWILPMTMAATILNNFLSIPLGKLSHELLLWSVLGAVGVGFGEEMITRGSMIVGLRSRFSEVQVWLFSTLLFSALHVPNVFFGLPVYAVPIQLAFTFVIGTGFYVIRCISGTLMLPMILHGLWDSALFLNMATGGVTSDSLVVIFPLAIVCAVAMFRSNRDGVTY